MLEDDVDDVLAVEVAPFAEEDFLSVVVVVGVVLELPGEAVVEHAGEGGADSPAGEGASALLHVVFRVVALAHGEQLKELPTPVFVGGVFVVLIVVEPEDHGGVLGHFYQHGAVGAHAEIPEHVNLEGHLQRAVDLGVGSGEDVVPEEGYLLFQGSWRVDEAVHPVAGHVLRVGGHLEAGGHAEKLVGVEGWDAVGFRLQKLFHGGFVAIGHAALEFVPVCAETGSPHEVGHKCNVLVRHTIVHVVHLSKKFPWGVAGGYPPRTIRVAMSPIRPPKQAAAHMAMFAKSRRSMRALTAAKPAVKSARIC